MSNWIDPQAQHFAFVHLPVSVDEMLQTYHDALRGILPAHPLLIVRALHHRKDVIEC